MKIDLGDMVMIGFISSSLIAWLLRLPRGTCSIRYRKTKPKRNAARQQRLR